MQTLRLADGICEIKAGRPGDEIRMRIFADSDSQVVYLEGESDREITVSAVLENWRKQPKVFDSLEIGSSWIFRGGFPEGVDYKNEEIGKLASTGPRAVAPVEGGRIELSAKEGAHLATGEFNKGYLAAPDSEAWSFPDGFTMEAWVKAARGGRIFDKVRPGATDGMLVDIHGGKLRAIVGRDQILGGEAFPVGEWTHVLFTGKPRGGYTLYDGPGNMANNLQEMLLQPGPDDALLLFPAWPREWDADFKLHAPRNTVIEGRFLDGKLEEMKVTPESRRRDVVLPADLAR